MSFHLLINLQVTPPFIVIELLLFGKSHHVAHDLESLFYVLLLICTHLGGPQNTPVNPPLYGAVTSCNHCSALKDWLNSGNLVSLGYTKFSHMHGFFEDSILHHISPYFQPLQVHLATLWHTIHPQRPQMSHTCGKDTMHSVVTCNDMIATFKTILLDKELSLRAIALHGIYESNYFVINF